MDIIFGLAIDHDDTFNKDNTGQIPDGLCVEKSRSRVSITFLMSLSVFDTFNLSYPPPTRREFTKGPKGISVSFM